MSETYPRQTPSDFIEPEVRRIATLFGWEESRTAHELVHPYPASMEEFGTGGENDLYVRSIVLDMTKFATKKEAKAAAERFNADAAKAQRDGETDLAYRTTVSGRTVRVEYGNGNGNDEHGWKPPG